MRKILELKNWQLFLIWIIGITQFMVFIQTDYWLISIEIYALMFIGWVYAIALYFNENNKKVKLKVNILLAIYLICIIPIGYKVKSIMLGAFPVEFSGLILLSGLGGSFISSIMLISISAKSLKEQEVGQEMELKDYLIELILFLYFIIGVWILQPRINKLVKNTANKIQKAF